MVFDLGNEIALLQSDRPGVIAPLSSNTPLPLDIYLVKYGSTNLKYQMNHGRTGEAPQRLESRNLIDLASEDNPTPDSHLAATIM